MYVKQRVHLSENQISKLRAAAKKKEKLSLDINPKLQGNFDLYLTQRQVNKFQKGSTCRIDLSPTQLKKNGGFIFTIPAILAAVGAISSIAGAASGIAKTVAEKKHQEAVESEQARHNTAVENLLKVKDQTSGKGAYISKKEKRSGTGTKKTTLKGKKK
jgi:hypothetical protein